MKLPTFLPVLIAGTTVACGEGLSARIDTEDPGADASQNETENAPDPYVAQSSCSSIPAFVADTANAILDRTYTIVEDGEIFAQDMTNDHEGAFILDGDMGGFYAPHQTTYYDVPVEATGAYHLPDLLSVPYDQYVANHVSITRPINDNGLGEDVDILAVDENIRPTVWVSLSVDPNNGECTLSDEIRRSTQTVCATDCAQFLVSLRTKIEIGNRVNESHYHEVCEVPGDDAPEECFVPYI